MTDENTERMIAEGWLFRCEVCGGIGDWVCDCPDGTPTTTLADAARVARKAAQSSEAPSPQSEAKPSAGNLPQDEPNYKALYTELKGEVLEKVGVIGRIARSNDGSRTFDDCIRDLMLIDDQCRALSTLYDKLSSIEVFPELPSDGGSSNRSMGLNAVPSTAEEEAALSEAMAAVDRWLGREHHCFPSSPVSTPVAIIYYALKHRLEGATS